MEYDSVASASIRAEDFLLYVFREEIVFGSLSGRIDLLSESLCCLLEGIPPRPSTLRASCPNPVVDVFGVAFGTGQDDDPASHPASLKRCRSRNSPMKSARLRPSCRRASCNEAPMAAASSAEGCAARQSSTRSSRLVVSCDWRSFSAANTANWRISSSVAAIAITPISRVLGRWLRCIYDVPRRIAFALRDGTHVQYSRRSRRVKRPAAGSPLTASATRKTSFGRAPAGSP